MFSIRFPFSCCFVFRFSENICFICLRSKGGKERESWINFRARCAASPTYDIDGIESLVPECSNRNRSERIPGMSFVLSRNFVEIASDTFKRDDWLQIFGMARGIPSLKRRDCWSGKKRPISKSMPRSYFLAIDSERNTLRSKNKHSHRMLLVLRYRISVSFSDVSGSGNSCSGILPTEEPEKRPLDLLLSDDMWANEWR